MWKNIKRGSFLLLLLSFLVCSAENGVSVSGGIATTEMVEIVNYEESAFPLFYLQCTTIKANLPTAYITFNFNIFQLRQDQNICCNLLKQQQVIIDYSYVLPLKKVIPFSIKEPLSYSY